MNTITATYSPDDNKIRLTAASRLDTATYERVRAAGFAWAPKLQQFVAPMWTPGREDLALELSGQDELEDEDSTLTDRAEMRAERFEDYSGKRLEDANRAADAVAAISEHIPLGQPILIGHHSERHARRDAERIESGMRRAVKMWETSEYWTRRAAAALAHAKYKERPDVRARRIATLEAAQRKMERGEAENTRKLNAWQKVDSKEAALLVANYCHLTLHFRTRDYPQLPRDVETSLWSAITDSICTWENARERAIRVYSGDGHREHYRRWKEHYSNRIAYERAMLGESGGLETDKVKPEKGGAVQCWVSRGQWLEIQKVNPKSVAVLDNWGNGGRDFLRVVPFDKLRAVMSRADWLAMQGKPADTPAPTAPKPGPICNYRVEGCHETTDQEWRRALKYGGGRYKQRADNGQHGRHKVREWYRGGQLAHVFVTDLPVKPAPESVAPVTSPAAGEVAA